MDNAYGKEMYDWCVDLFPINRSLTGNGVRETLAYFKKLLPSLEIHEIPSGTKAFDWEVPNEWTIREGWIKDSNGVELINFKNHNLHVMGYSAPINKIVMKSELDQHLFSLPDSPDAIPYVTSFYELGWGFCVSEKDRQKFGEGPFHVFIDSELAPGHMTYAELLIPGLIEDEILFSTYVCHPSMANNELSGPAVLAKISQLLLADSAPKYSYRILFLVETIGSLHYISQNLASLKENVKAGFVLTCIGDDRVFSYVPTRAGNTLSDRVARKIFKSYGSFGIEYTWFDRGSDERQFNAPGIDLPIASIMRSKYGQYPEYHTSLDDLSVISPAGLLGGLNMVWDVIRILERNAIFRINVLGEPQLGRRGLYPNTSIKTNYVTVQNQMNVISCLDGSKDLIEISEICGLDFESVWSIMCDLIEANLVECSNL